MIIQSRVKSVKKHETVKNALNPHALNNAVVRDKSQTLNMDHWVDFVAKQEDEDKGNEYFSSLDRLHRNRQVDIDIKRAEQGFS